MDSRASRDSGDSGNSGADSDPQDGRTRSVAPPSRAGHTPARRSRVRPISVHYLALDEHIVDLTFLTINGDWVILPNVLISPRYQESFVAAFIANNAGPVERLPEAEMRTVQTPRGPMRTAHVVCLWFGLQEQQQQQQQQQVILLPLSPARLPVLEYEMHGHHGVNMIIGRPLVERCRALYGPEWPRVRYDSPSPLPLPPLAAGSGGDTGGLVRFGGWDYNYQDFHRRGPGVMPDAGMGQGVGESMTGFTDSAATGEYLPF